MDLSSSPARVVPCAYHGAETRRLSSPSQLKIQFTGPGAETILLAGPPEGKMWDVTVKVFVDETECDM